MYYVGAQPYTHKELTARKVLNPQVKYTPAKGVLLFLAATGHGGEV